VIPWFTIPPLWLWHFELDVPTCFAFAGAVMSMVFVRWRAPRAALSAKAAVDGVFVILVSAFVLGHVFDVLLYRQSEFWTNWRVILPWYYGSCSLGALGGLILATAITFRAPRGGIDWRYVDEAALAVLLGLGILRVGCFLGHHHAGRRSNFVLAVQFPKGARHDLGLYEAVLVFAILGAVLLLHRRFRGQRPGLISVGALLLYASGRFLLEFLRGDDLEIIGRHSDSRYLGLTGVQYGALLMVASGAWLLRSIERSRARLLENSNGRQKLPAVD